MSGAPTIDYGAEGEARLRRFVEQATGGTIRKWERQVRWRPAWFVDVECDGALLQLHLRGDRQSDIVPFPELRREADVIDVLHKSGIPVPKIHGFCEKPPAILMESLPGTRDLSAFSAEARQKISRQYIAAVAAMHQAPIAPFVARGISEPEPDMVPLAGMEAYLPLYARVKRRPEPLIEFAFGWLRRNVPPGRTRPAFTQYDSGQFLAEGERMTGLYDFEFGMIGDPMMDLATMRMRDSYEPLGETFPELCRLYGEATGEPVDQAAVAFHTLQFSTLSTMMIAGAVADPKPGEPHAVYLEWDLALRRVVLHGLAECMGQSLPTIPPAVLVSPPADPLVAMLRDTLSRIVSDDPLQSSHRERAAELVEYLHQTHLFEKTFGAQELDEISQMVGKELADRPAADAELEGFVQRAGPECDERLFRMFAIQHERRVALLGNTAIGRSARNVHLPEMA